MKIHLHFLVLIQCSASSLIGSNQSPGGVFTENRNEEKVNKSDS